MSKHKLGKQRSISAFLLQALAWNRPKQRKEQKEFYMKGGAYFNKFICVLFYFLIFQLHCLACGISVPWPGIKLAVLPYISSAVLTTVYHGGGGPGKPPEKELWLLYMFGHFNEWHITFFVTSIKLSKLQESHDLCHISQKAWGEHAEQVWPGSGWVGETGHFLSVCSCSIVHQGSTWPASPRIKDIDTKTAVLFLPQGTALATQSTMVNSQKDWWGESWRGYLLVALLQVRGKQSTHQRHLQEWLLSTAVLTWFCKDHLLVSEKRFFLRWFHKYQGQDLI